MSGVSVDDKTPVWLIERLEKALDVMPRWTPGMMQGEKVRIQVSLPLRFGAKAKADSLGAADVPFLIAERMPTFRGGRRQRVPRLGVSQCEISQRYV